jgi:hypothetical protein
MKKQTASILVLLAMACTSSDRGKESIVYQPEDKTILSQVFEQFSAEEGTPVPELMVKIGTYFLGTPYVAHTLETDSAEQLVVNLREMDCTTFAENCLAISRTIHSGKLTFEQFTNELKEIRYRNGILDGYPSRLHYFSDWIYNNHQNHILRDVTREMAGIPYPINVHFMSTHPESYRQLKADSSLIKRIEAQEKEISARQMYYIPEEQLATVEDQLQDGDIAGLTTNMDGLDISHVILLVRKEGRIHLMHASSLAEKVIVSEETLETYLLNSNRATGIMVARPL